MNHTTSMLVFAAVVSILLVTPSLADETRGRLLYENHCTVCHESTLHIREDRRVADRAGLMTMVVRWSGELKLDWTAEEMVDVVDFLDAEYYHTGKSSL